jgi:ribosomal protein S18 acetylase RimI-like enzyme
MGYQIKFTENPQLFQGIKDSMEKGPTRAQLAIWLLLTPDELNHVSAYYAISSSGEVLGFVLLRNLVLEPLCLGLHRDPWQVHWVWVAPDQRRRGIATSLLIEARNKYQLSAYCLTPESRALHKKAGFTLGGRRGGDYVMMTEG